jgi:hypothetical protein
MALPTANTAGQMLPSLEWIAPDLNGFDTPVVGKVSARLVVGDPPLPGIVVGVVSEPAAWHTPSEQVSSAVQPFAEEIPLRVEECMHCKDNDNSQTVPQQVLPCAQQGAAAVSQHTALGLQQPVTEAEQQTPLRC